MESAASLRFEESSRLSFSWIFLAETQLCSAPPSRSSLKLVIVNVQVFAARSQQAVVHNGAWKAGLLHGPAICRPFFQTLRPASFKRIVPSTML